MSNQLRIYGDSFSVPSVKLAEKPAFDTWTDIVAKNLSVNECNYTAQWGVSNEWIFDHLIKDLDTMTEGDYVIVQTSQTHRQWFFEDQPDVANYYVANLEKLVTPERAAAIKTYITHLHNPRVDEIRYLQFCLALERIADVYKHLRILILPGFGFVNGCIGNLANLSDQELDTSEHHIFYGKNGGVDPRPNHLSESNHKILADKILNFFNHGTTIDLTDGFEKNIHKVEK